MAVNGMDRANEIDWERERERANKTHESISLYLLLSFVHLYFSVFIFHN